MKPLLFEIGSEEIPARFVSVGLELLREGFARLLEGLSIEYENISGYATPRRLAIYIEGVSVTQKDIETEALGPPKRVAFDEKGSPTKAATGFAKSLNMDVKDLEIKKTERGEYLAARQKKKGGPTTDVLAKAMPGFISSLQLPKSMRWGNGSMRFFRPIHWILAVLGKEIIAFSLEGIKSSNISYGHRFLSPAAIKINEPAEYANFLKRNYVLADIAERKAVISEGLKEIESALECRVHEDAELLEIVTNLVEYPTVVAGNFDEKYIGLPPQLLITVMKTHQKYFSVEDSDGNMLPSFIVVSNTKAENNDTVRKGAERVLRARLEDAGFYYVEDRKIPFSDYTERLKKVTFQEKLGTLFRKAERISALSSLIAERLNPGLKDKLLRSAMLCKADLVTGVVGEFPELQGYMGMIYALESGEDRETAAAIYEHYLPRFPGDSLPSGELGAIVSIADKMDNVASFFFLGLIPTGSEDPFALRRQAAGIISILQESGYPLSLNILTDKSLENLVSDPGEKKELSSKIRRFFIQRLEGILLSGGYSHDMINAVLSGSELNIRDIKDRIGILSGFRKDPRFSGLLQAAKRVYNILSKAGPGDINEDLLVEDYERELFVMAKKVSENSAATDFRALFELERPVNSFFDNVLVMDKDERIRENRLALLFFVKREFDSLGDFSKIVE